MSKFDAHAGDKVILGGKNAKAAGRIAGLKADFWQVIDRKTTVGFSDKAGPWILCVPNKGSSFMKEHQVWVNINQDYNFDVWEAK